MSESNAMSLNMKSLTEVLSDLHTQYENDENYWVMLDDGRRAKDIQYVLVNEPELFQGIVIEDQVLAFQATWLENTYMLDTSEPDASTGWLLMTSLESYGKNGEKPSVLTYHGFSKLEVVEED